jgi:deoxyribonuclease-4
VSDSILLGAHISSAGGVPAAPPRAKAIGATAMQFFSKMASRWAERHCGDEECAQFTAALAETAVLATSIHDSYLINLASPDDMLRLRSTISFISELKRCEALGVQFLVSHPGNFMDDRASGIDRNVEGIVAGLECVPGRTVLLLETTAGSGTALGASFEEMATIIERIPRELQSRVGVCADTAHLFAAGYDLAGDFDAVWERFDDIVGLERLRMMHLNDSKVPLGSRRDRHELIGEGAIGEGAFRRIMTDRRFAAVPKVIETPKLNDAEATDRRMLTLLRSFAATAALAMLLVGAPVSAHGQNSALGRWSSVRIGAELGITGGTRLIEDGSGISVRQRISPSLGLNAQLPLSPRIAVGGSLRAARMPLTVEQSGSRWSGGTAYQYDIALSVAHQLPGMLVGHIGALGAIIFGPRDLVPFRLRGGRVGLLGSEIGLSRRLGRAPLHATVDGQLLRLGGQSSEDPPINAGWIGRIRIGVRHAR